MNIENPETMFTGRGKNYRGRPEADDQLDIAGDVYVYEGDHPIRLLDPRLDLANHSPTGFAWAYGGSGPAQLALAILADVAGDEIALDLYQRFKAEEIATLPRGAWIITEAHVIAWLERNTEGRS